MNAKTTTLVLALLATIGASLIVPGIANAEWKCPIAQDGATVCYDAAHFPPGPDGCFLYYDITEHTQTDCT